MTIYETPEPDPEDRHALDEIHELREELSSNLRVPRRWTGALRRTTQARAIRGSNTIEGYDVSEQDAIAAVDDEEPLGADERTWAEITGYRRALTYVLTAAPEPHFRIDSQLVRSLHFMLLEHDLSKGPGRYRPGSVYVHDESDGSQVYEGPDADAVPGLMKAMAGRLESERDVDPMIRGAMAHLNLVMIHPFRDGNGRMARVLQTAALGQDTVLEPTFSSIEEWLGQNTTDYYRVLAATGQGAWNPQNDAHPWVKFVLRAHHMQAQTLRRRFAEADVLWRQIDDLVAEHRLPDRVGDALFDALQGGRVQRPSYVRRAEVEDRTGTRDLVRLTELGLLEAVGKTRARHYLAGPVLRGVAAEVRSGRQPLADPYPWLQGWLRGEVDRAS
ncbi:Fic family protein [Agilicoccus flavus]|uniref:Fic family protein n=1 Tax=Agilicoccus flavus TaxID=2775968 RepID=UPI001CF7108B|nr:Fic family protein [Agilicoccus flavus]